VIWVTQGHWQMSSFNRVHTTSYSAFIEKMHLSCIIFETQDTASYYGHPA